MAPLLGDNRDHGRPHYEVQQLDVTGRQFYVNIERAHDETPGDDITPRTGGCVRFGSNILVRSATVLWLSFNGRRKYRRDVSRAFYQLRSRPSSRRREEVQVICVRRDRRHVPTGARHHGDRGHAV